MSGTRGTDEGRAGVDALLTLVRSGEVDAVVVWRLDRLAREMLPYAEVVGTLDRYRVPLFSLHEDFNNTTPTGRLHRNLGAVLAAHERDVIRERTMRGRAARALDGWTGGSPPFGFRIDRTQRVAQLVICDTESATMREMVRCLLDERMTTKQTARHLSALESAERERIINAGEPEPARWPWTPRTSTRWTYSVVRSQLRYHRGLSGTWTFRRSDGPDIEVKVPELITPERHEALRRRLAENAADPPSRVGRYLLGGGRLVSECGSAMYGVPRTRREQCAKHDVYCCQRRAIDGADACGCRRLDVTELDESVWDELVRLLTDADRLQQLAGLTRQAVGAHEATEADDVRALDRRIARLERDIATQIPALLRAGMDANAVALATNDLQADLDATRERRAQVLRWSAQNIERSSRAASLVQLAETAQRSLLNPTPELQAHVVELLDLRVTVTGSRIANHATGRARFEKAAAVAAHRSPVRPVIASAAGPSSASPGSCPKHRASGGRTLHGTRSPSSHPDRPEAPSGHGAQVGRAVSFSGGVVRRVRRTRRGLRAPRWRPTCGCGSCHSPW